MSTDQKVFVVSNLKVALARRLLPTITVYNRLEARPRTRQFDRALKAEVRDALWMLTRQWQLGELTGDDAGSPIQAKLAIERSELRHYRPREGTVQPFDTALPLEARVERRPVRLRSAERDIALDLRMVMGRQWLKLIADLPNDYAAAFLDAYPIVAPDPGEVADADQAAHPEVLQAFAAAAGRRMDGGKLYRHLTGGGAAPHAYDGVAGVADADKPAIDTRAERFVAWFARLLAPPAAPEEDAWDANRLEYRFACSAPARGRETVYAAEEYHGGHLDWWAFDSDPAADALAPPPDPAAPPDPHPLPERPPARTLIPTPVVFEGMPNTRWWAFEDRRTNLGAVDAATTDLGKLLFLEFGLVYANDWFLMPMELDVGSVASVRGLAVTSVFGERFWIEPAGRGPDDDWQRWTMFNVSVRGHDDAQQADLRLLLPPTVPKIQESEPLEGVALIRDEVANMVWGVERVVPLPSGDSKPGAEAARETLAYLTRLAGPAPAPPPGRVADIAYDLVSTVPEHWIPFLPAHVPGDTREIQLQRAALPRTLPGAPTTVVKPRTGLLREGLDAEPPATPTGYLVHEEEVPRAGTHVEQSFQRTRWRGGRTVTWLGVRRGTGRGEGSSGLAFDRLVDVPPED
jgi:hypothetical protein